MQSQNVSEAYEDKLNRIEQMVGQLISVLQKVPDKKPKTS
jgi:hypothetical protein